MGFQRVTDSFQVPWYTYDGDPVRFAARAGGKRVKKTEGVTSTVYIGAIYEKNVTTGVTTTYQALRGRVPLPALHVELNMVRQPCP